MKLKLLLLMSLLFFVEIGFSQNTVTYSSLNNTINVNSGVEGTVDVLVNCYGSSSNPVFIDATQSCGTSDGVLSTTYTNGSILTPGQNTIIRFKFKKTVTTDTQIVYKFSTNGSCFQDESKMIKITVNYKSGSTTTPTIPTGNNQIIISVYDHSTNTWPSSFTINEGDISPRLEGGFTSGVTSRQWQIKQNGAWVDIPGATDLGSYYPGTIFVTSQYRRKLKINGLLSYSNEVTIVVIPAPGIQNNTITLNGNSVFGSLPTGGIGVYQYSWVIRRGLEDIPLPDTGQNLEFPSWTYSPVNEYIKAGTGLYVIRFVKSGSHTLSSNVLKIPPTPSVQNNTIALDGNIVFGSLPTGGNGIYQYSWIIRGGLEDIPLPNTGQNLEFPSWTYSPVNEYIKAGTGLYVIRFVKSGSHTILSNVLKIPPTPSVQNNTIALDGNIVFGSLPTGGNGIYQYSWVIRGGLEDIPLPDTGQNLEFPSWTYSPVNEYIKAGTGLYVIRFVKSGSHTLSSNVLKIPPSNSNKIASNATTIQSDLSIEELTTVYPNPTSGSINFSTAFSTDKDIEITVYSENLKQAKSVFKGQITPNQTVNWDIPSNYSKGVYFYKILSDNKEVKSGKLIFR